jgi:hypothetical protein
MSVIPADALSHFPLDEQVLPDQFCDVRLIDARALTCRYKGQQPLILHATHQPKPWQSRGVYLRRQLSGDVYLRFLRRLLTGPDVALKVPAPLLKIWLRQGVVPELAYYGLAFANFFARRLASSR